MTEENELQINFKALWELIWQDKFKILAISILFGILGGGYAFLRKNYYISYASIMPEYQSSKLGGLGKFAGLASLAGVDINSMPESDAIRPDLYPNILSSTPFFLELLKTKVKNSSGKEEKFRDFYYRAYDIDLSEYNVKDNSKSLANSIRALLGIETPEIILSADSISNVTIRLTKLDFEIIEDLRQKITASMDKKSGIIVISAELADPVTAAEVAHFGMGYLTNFVSNYRTEKARKDMEFLAERVDESRGKYYSTQAKKAQYSDQFQLPTIRLQSADIQRERLESEYRVSSSFYNDLLKQYENSKLKVQQETPVFKILEPAVIPIKKNGPRRLIIIACFLILGSIVGLAWILIRKNRYKSVMV